MTEKINPRNHSAAPGGNAAPAAPSDEQPKPLAAAPGTISTRLDRLKLWHAGAKSSAARLKLFIFLAGAEINALKNSLDVRPGPISETVSPISESLSLCGEGGGWKDLIAHQVGMTYRTARNYELAYLTISRELPDLSHRILDAVDISLKTDQAPLALQLKFEEHLQKIRPADLDAFTQATDPWSLSDLYKRELKPADAAIAIEKSKKQAEKKDQIRQMEFWFGEVAKEIKRKEYLRFPREQREMLLEELELAVSELKASLKAPRQ